MGAGGLDYVFSSFCLYFDLGIRGRENEIEEERRTVPIERIFLRRIVANQLTSFTFGSVW